MSDGKSYHQRAMEADPTHVDPERGEEYRQWDLYSAKKSGRWTHESGEMEDGRYRVVTSDGEWFILIPIGYPE